MTLEERAELWPATVLSREQPFKRSCIGARHVEYLHPASGPCHQRDRAGPDSERRSHRGQRGRSRPPVRGWVADPDHQGTIVLSAHARTGRPGPDPDSNTHPTSVRPGTSAGDRFWQGKETCAVIKTGVTAVQSPTMTG